MNIRLPGWTVPVALLIISILSFGLLIPSLGFYWDDWPSLVITRLQGAQGFQQFFNLDRPTTHISYVLLMPLLGADPVGWQVFSLVLRWLSAVLLWWLVRLLWPDTNEIATWAAILFAVHPVFRQQPIALTYHQLWLQSAFYMLSLAGMIAAIRQPSRRIIWTAAGLTGLAANFLISEYFLGIEFLRPVILWLAVQGMSQTWRRRLKATLINWLPYLAVLLVYLSWRFIFMDLPGPDRNAPILLSGFLAAPIKTLLELAQMAIQDSLYILVTSWYATLQPQLFDLQQRFNLFSLVTGLGAALACGIYLFTLRRDQGTANQDSALAKAAMQVLGLGLLIAAVAPLPGWVTGRQVIVGAWSDRLAVPAIFGASLALAGCIAWLARRHAQQILLISLLAGLAVGYNLRVANDYRWARIQQNRFFWQLYWRAPAIEPNTAIMAAAEVLPKTGLYSTAAGINIIYAQPSPSGQMPYWFYSLSREFGHRLPELVGGLNLETAFRHFTFQGQSSQSLIVHFQPSDADCLRILTPQDAVDPALPDVVVQALPIIDLSRIHAGPNHNNAPEETIFGAEPEHGWCYLFQKADLARQTGDWAQVITLGDQAREMGYNMQNSQSNTPQEWIPFIEGYARVGRWQEAMEITRAALEVEPKMSARACDLWRDIRTAQPQADAQAAVQELISTLSCPP